METRVLFSFTFGSDLTADAASGKAGKPTPAPAPAIRLDLVALHEFGHALGLGHSTNQNSIMYAYYNANYILANFASDPAVAELKTDLDNNATGWNRDIDEHTDRDSLDLTYSFMPDGATIAGEQGKAKTSSLQSTLLAKFGANWKSILSGELIRWSTATSGKVTFQEVSEVGVLAFNYSGASQNDAKAGDIRIGGHTFDGAGKVLAHTYYPPPNGSTAAGDAHFDVSEMWTSVSGTTTSASFVQKTSSSTDTGAFSFGRTITSLFLFDSKDKDHWLA